MIDTTTRLLQSTVTTLVGDFFVVADEADVVVAAAFTDHADGIRRYLDRHVPDREIVQAETAPTRALRDYLDGDLHALDAVRTHAEGSLFQRSVWSALRQIPAGSTWTYGDLAAAAGHPTAHRAVGSANGANPVSLFVPCHRVVPATGGVGGYGGGTDRKAWLLRHEGVHLG